MTDEILNGTQEKAKASKCTACGKEQGGYLIDYKQWDGKESALNGIIEQKEIETIAYECASCHSIICTDCVEKNKEKFNFRSLWDIKLAFKDPFYFYKYLYQYFTGSLRKCPKCGQTMKILKQKNSLWEIGNTKIVIPLGIPEKDQSVYAKKFISVSDAEFLEQRITAIKEAEKAGKTLCPLCGSASVQVVTGQRSYGCCSFCTCGAIGGSFKKTVCAECSYEWNEDFGLKHLCG